MKRQARDSIGARRLRTMLACGASGLLAACAAFAALADDYSWNAASGFWSHAGNWSPLGVPDLHDVAHIGDLAHIHDDTVFLNMDASVSGLHLSDGMGFQTEGFDMEVRGTTTLFGDSTRLVVQEGGLVDFYTRDMVLGGTSRVIQYGGRMHVNGVLTIGTGAQVVALEGEGSIWFPGGDGTMLVNNGRIGVGNAGMRFFPLANTTRFDLDGVTENGELLATATEAGRLEFVARGLSDPFSGVITLNNGRLQMHLFEPWEADASSVIQAFRSGPTQEPNRIEGQPFTFGGQLNVSPSGGWPADLMIESDMTFKETAETTVDDQCSLELTGSTTVLGGTYFAGNAADMIFSGDTTLRGGMFATTGNGSVSLTGGSEIKFNGPTVWNGEITFDGSAVQNGDAEASGALGAVIHAGRFDLDGASGDTTWDVNANLVINAARIDQISANRFTGTMNIAGGLMPRLTLNVSGLSASWTMAGVMNLNGLTHLFETRVGGSPMIVEGELNVAGGKVHISADARFSDLGGGALVHIGPADAVLGMGGRTQIDAGVLFSGAGSLQNGTMGEMTLMNGATLNATGLVNRGVLAIDPGAGTVSVDRFENAGDGTLVISLGGYAQGAEYDMLTATNGPALLDGTIEIELIDLGAGVFDPSVGDSFVILQANAGVIGAFANDPVSIVEGRTYTWSVLYTPGSVVLYLKSIEE